MRTRVATAATALGLFVTGCVISPTGLLDSLFDLPAATPTGIAAAVADKAEAIARRVGDPNGFAPGVVEDFFSHMGPHMGFRSMADLADPNAPLRIELVNDANQPCVFHLSWIASHEGLDEQTLDVVVGPGDSEQVELPCAEIVGLGTLDEPGAPAAHLDDGTPLENRYCVPGFLHDAFECGGMMQAVLAPDADDLDNDGDTDELIVTTGVLWAHMRGRGPMHGSPAMMGPFFRQP